MFETYVFSWTAPAWLHIAIPLFFFLLLFFCGIDYGTQRTMEKARERSRFWRNEWEKLAYEVAEYRKSVVPRLEAEVKFLEHVKTCYAPEWDKSAGRWRDGRTGEFMEEEDVIEPLRKEKDRA